MFRLVAEAVVRPNKCCVYPQLGSVHERGFVDTGQDLVGLDPHVYVSVVAVEEMGRLIGLVDASEVDGVREQLNAALGELEAARADLAEARRVIDAIDAIESADFRARKRAGRKPGQKPEKAEVAA